MSKCPAQFSKAERQLAENAFGQLSQQLSVRLSRQTLNNDAWLTSKAPTATHTDQVGKVKRITVRVDGGRQLFGQKARVFVNHRLFESA